MAQVGEEFIGVIEFRTAKAILFRDWFWVDPMWFPLSQCELIIDWETPDEAQVKATWWICAPAQNDLDEFKERVAADEAEEVDDSVPVDEEYRERLGYGEGS